MSISYARRRTEGEAVDERLQGTKLPPRVAPYAKAFRDAQRAFAKALDALNEAEEARLSAEGVVAERDADLDRALEDLAAALVGSKLGKRTNPFADFVKFAPAGLKDLAWTKEADVVEKLLRRVRKAKPPKTVLAEVARCEELVSAVRKGLKALTAPAHDEAKARAKRDDAFARQVRALERLKLQAKATMTDDAAALRALFAASAPAHATKKRTNGKAAAKKKANGKSSAKTPPPAPAT